MPRPISYDAGTFQEVALGDSGTPNARTGGVLSQTDADEFERLKAVLACAFAAPEGAYRRLSADDVIRRSARPESA